MKIKNNWQELLYKNAYEKKWEGEILDLLFRFMKEIIIPVKFSSTQDTVLDYIEENSPCRLKYTEIGKAVGINHPQKVKHHIQRLSASGKITINECMIEFNPLNK